jgi:hypothetical protein
MTFSGSIDDVNAALDGLTYAPTTAYSGVAVLNIATTDSVDGWSDFDSMNLIVGNDLQATATSSSGLSINHDGGNDIYLEVEDGAAIVDGLSAFTTEFQFSSVDSTGEHGLLEYTDGSENLMMRVQSNGTLQVRINGELAVLNTVDYQSQLFDGHSHTLSVSWDSATGALRTYIDGVLADTATLATGQTINGSNNPLVIGRQYGNDGSFDNEFFEGTLHDVRIFDVVRSDSDIAAHFRSSLPYDEANLVANWTFDNAATDGVILDTVGGNNLTIQHAQFTGAIKSEAELLFTVDENSLDGTIVGQLTGIDPERQAQIAALLSADSELVYDAQADKFYKAFTGAINGTTAENTAATTLLNGVGGELPTIESFHENNLVHGLIASTGENGVWLSGTDSEVADEWRWADGTLFYEGGVDGTNVDGRFENFSALEPNGGTNPSLVRSSIQSSGEWKDSSSSLLFTAMVVEWDAWMVRSRLMRTVEKSPSPMVRCSTRTRPRLIRLRCNSRMRVATLTAKTLRSHLTIWLKPTVLPATCRAESS